MSPENMAPIRIHAPTEDSRRAAGWGRLNLRIPPELWAEVARIPADQRGRVVCRYLADRLGVQLKPRHSERKDSMDKFSRIEIRYDDGRTSDPGNPGWVACCEGTLDGHRWTETISLEGRPEDDAHARELVARYSSVPRVDVSSATVVWRDP